MNLDQEMVHKGMLDKGSIKNEMSRMEREKIVNQSKNKKKKEKKKSN